MNPFLQPRISSTASWMDANLHESSPWDDAAALQLDGIFSGPLETYARGTSKPEMIGSPPIPESNLNMQINPSTFIDPIMNYSMVPKHTELQQDIQDPVPIQDESANVRHVESRIFAEHDLAAGLFIQEASSLFLQSFVDAQSSSIAPLWQPYTDASGPIEQSNFQGFGLCRDLENSRDIFVNESSNHGLQQASVYTRSFYENESLANSQMPSYITCPGMNLPNNTGISNNHQPSDRDSGKNLSSNVTNDSLNIGTGNTASPIGASKPRARARRGQATDPHSIAERLRREKIAERMKNLQELVPNSNKADKGSMLDEIIEYVKFLQLQVKVLSMSRLGATGAVVPLITDQSQDTMNLGLTSDIDSDLSQENIAFEQEVVKLMESDVTAAMQFLQTKGLCLIPIALASAISARKGSSAAIPLKKLEGAGHSVNANTSKSREKLAEQHVLNGCNKTVAREDEEKMSPGSARNLKFQA